MKRATVLIGLLLVGGCGLMGNDGNTDPAKEPWRPGPLGGKADDTILEKGSISFGAALKGIAINKNELHRYTFFAISGADIRIEMSADAGSGNPDTYLQLETPGGKIFTDDDGGAGLNSRLEQLGLPDSGTYTLYATTYRRAGSGDYSLALTCLSGTCAVTPQMKTDDDHDGYSELQGDCDDTTPDRSPGAPEIPGNSKDDDCDGKVDEGCNDPTTCDRPPRAPTGVAVQGKYYGYADRCRVSGNAEPSTTLTIYSNSRRQNLKTGVAVPSSGSFSVVIYGNCYPGDVLVLWVNDQTSQSGKVWYRASGSDGYAPLAVNGASATVPGKGQVQIDGTTELGATVLLTNTSQNGKAVEVPAGAGFGTPFSGALAADAGDWIRVEARDPSGNVSSPTMVQVSGSDTTAPDAPTGVAVQGKYYGYADRCRVSGNAEPNSTLTIYSNSRRQNLKTATAVSAAGSFSVVIYGNCYPGDVLQLWVSDGTNPSPKVVATASGTDGYAPLAPTAVSVSPVQGGQVTVSATVEINGGLVVTNTYDNSQHSAQAGADGKVTLQLPAWHGDQLKLQSKDAAGNLSSPTFQAVP